MIWSGTVILQRNKGALSDAGQSESGGPKSPVGFRGPGFRSESTTSTSDCPGGSVSLREKG